MIEIEERRLAFATMPPSNNLGRYVIVGQFANHPAMTRPPMAAIATNSGYSAARRVMDLSVFVFATLRVSSCTELCLDGSALSLSGCEFALRDAEDTGASSLLVCTKDVSDERLLFSISRKSSSPCSVRA